MKVRFSYHQGPEQGHAMRCRILQDELVRRGHEIVDRDAEIGLYDFLSIEEGSYHSQKEHIQVLLGQYGGGLEKCEDGILRERMWSSSTLRKTWGWHPLGNPQPRTLTGIQYAILDPLLADFAHIPKQDYALITMGGADQERHTEMVLDALYQKRRDVRVVLGPTFGRDVAVMVMDWPVKVYSDLTRLDFLSALAAAGEVVCAWGTTALEATYLGARVFIVARYPWQMEEAQRAGIKAYYPFDAWERLRMGQQGDWVSSDVRVDLDLHGAARTADWLEMLYRVYGGDM